MDKLIVQAKYISFCFGVQKSLNLINKLIKSKKYKYIYMLGEIIHNKQVIRDLKNKGIKIINDVFNIPEIEKDSIVIIQSHGVSPEVYQILKKRNINFIDSTCPLVKKIHKAIAELEKEGYYPIILGSKTHTEVIGISGYVKNRPIIISKKEEINRKIFLQKNINNVNINQKTKNKIDKITDKQNIIKKAGIVMQSTFFYDKVEEIIKEIKKYVSEVKVIYTICEPTKLRQKETTSKSKIFKSVIIVGSQNSSNTKKLFSISKKNNPNSFLVTDEDDVNKIDFSNLTPIFLTSGASTPMYLINNIKKSIIQNIKKYNNKFLKFSFEYKPKIDNEIKKIFEKKIYEIKNLIILNKNLDILNNNVKNIGEKNKSTKNKNLIIKNLINENPINNLEKILIELKNFCLRPGKRIRPLLVIWGYLTFGGKNKYLNEIIKLAALIEIMHAALLIHDDIIDQSDLRRGEKSIHKLMEEMLEGLSYNKNIGTDLAIVLGDLLYFLSFEIIYNLKIPLKYKNNLMELFGNCYFYTGIGQCYDILFTKMKNFNINILNTGISFASITNLLKTSFYTIYYPIIFGISLTPNYNKIDFNSSSLLNHSIKINHNNSTNRNDIRKYAIKTEHDKKNLNISRIILNIAIPLGIAFQLRDDIISIFENSENTGKSNNSDIEESKITALVEETFKLLNNNEINKFKSLFFKNEKNIDEINHIKKVITQSGALTNIKNKIKLLFSFSKKNIEILFENSFLKNINSDLKMYKDIFLDLIKLLENY